MKDYDKPSEMTYRHYRQNVETAAEAAYEAMADYPEDYDNLHDAVVSTVDGDYHINNYGYMLMTVLLSDQSPDSPDYCESWDVYCDLSNDPSWSDAVGAMAYVCFYSDVYEKLEQMRAEEEEA